MLFPLSFPNFRGVVPFFRNLVGSSPFSSAYSRSELAKILEHIVILKFILIFSKAAVTHGFPEPAQLTNRAEMRLPAFRPLRLSDTEGNQLQRRSNAPCMRLVFPLFSSGSLWIFRCRCFPFARLTARSPIAHQQTQYAYTRSFKLPAHDLPHFVPNRRTVYSSSTIILPRANIDQGIKFDKILPILTR